MKSEKCMLAKKVIVFEDNCVELLKKIISKQWLIIQIDYWLTMLHSECTKNIKVGSIIHLENASVQWMGFKLVSNIISTSAFLNVHRLLIIKFFHPIIYYEFFIFKFIVSMMNDSRENMWKHILMIKGKF